MEYRFQRTGAPRLDDGKLSGRAAPFNKPAMIGKKPWGFRETIAPGCFAKTIKDGDVVLLDNHQSDKPIARQSAGTLTMMETRGGLDWDAIPADTTYANDVRENAKAGNYGGCSFGFEVIRDSWHYNKEDDVDERTLLEVKLREISVCTFPAYEDGTSVSARDMVDAAMEARDRFYEDQYAAHLEDTDEYRANKKPYGNVAYADPKNGKYPIDTKAHCKAAWSYINMPKNAAKYPLNGVSLSSVKAKIKAACKKFGISISQQNAAGMEEEEIRVDNDDVKKTDKRGRVVLKGGRKTLARVREILFDESRAVDADVLLIEARKVILDDLVEQAERASIPPLLGGAAGNPQAKGSLPATQGAGQGGNKVGVVVPLNDKDNDDPICPACNGSGLQPGTNGTAWCAGGCGGTGRISAGGDNKGSTGTDAAGDNKDGHQDSSFGLGLKKGKKGNKGGQGNNPSAGSKGGSGNPVNAVPGYGSGGAPSGTPSKGAGNPGGSGAKVAVTGAYSKDFDGEESREDGQPDASTDTEREADTARRMRAVARAAQMRREMADAKAGR